MDVEIEVPRPLMDCFLYCEVHCVRECCGINAVSTDLGLIAEWGQSAGPEIAVTAMRQVIDLITLTEDRSHNVSSLFLNHYTCHEAARKQLLDFLGAFRSGLASAAEP